MLARELMPNPAPRLSLLAALLLLVCAARGSAQDAPAAPPRHTPEQLTLTGPRTAVGWGAALVLAAPVVGLAAGIKVTLDGANFLGCDDWGSGQTDEECEAEDAAHDAKVARQLPWVIAGAAALGAGGGALLGWGISRLIKIRRARRHEQLLQSPQLAVSPQGAQLSLRLRF